MFGEVSNDAKIAREEIFGPVLAVIGYTDQDAAVALANDSDYGLAGTVFTTDLERGLGVARRIRTGTFGINGYNPDVGSPHGGVKASGLGRELGPEGLAPYLQPKSIYLPA